MHKLVERKNVTQKRIVLLKAKFDKKLNLPLG